MNNPFPNNPTQAACYRQVAVLVVAAVLAISPLASPALAQSQEDAVRTALNVCTDLPTEIEPARESLRAGGWVSAEDAAISALFNAYVAFNFNADDLQYTFSNAGFMAASVLGNSALGPDQVGMELDGYRIAVLGISEGTPYCVLTGPDQLLALLERIGFEQTTQQISGVLGQTMGSLPGGHQVAAARVDLAALEPLLMASDLPEDRVSQILSTISPSTVHIAYSEGSE